MSTSDPLISMLLSGKAGGSSLPPAQPETATIDTTSASAANDRPNLLVIASSRSLP